MHPPLCALALTGALVSATVSAAVSATVSAPVSAPVSRDVSSDANPGASAATPAPDSPHLPHSKRAAIPYPPTASAQAVDAVDEAARLRGNRVQVAVLGTSHLRDAPAALAQPALFEPLVAALAAFKPQVVATESLSGAQCDQLRAYAFIYEGTAAHYCPDPSEALAVLKHDGVSAEREIDVLLASPADRPPAQRRRLAALLLAVGEPASAAVQWLRLPPAERVADSSLTAALIAQLNQRLAQRTEEVLIAIPLAVRLGLERVDPVDDHTGDRAAGNFDPAVWQATMTRLWANPQAEQRSARDAQVRQQAQNQGEVLSWYRWLNASEAAQLAVAGDFAAAAADRGPERIGRSYLAYWETRNLRMVANIRELLGRTHADRALLIVGAAHKPYYERYLGMSSDVEIMPVDPWLMPKTQD